LYCPFGCRSERKKELTAQRGRKHTQTPQGRIAKRKRNSKRYRNDTIGKRYLSPNNSENISIQTEHSQLPRSTQDSLSQHDQLHFQNQSQTRNFGLFNHLLWIVKLLLGHQVSKIQVFSQFTAVWKRFSSQRSLRWRGG
jgi:hypothetical protein